MKQTLIFGDDPYGLKSLPKRTWWRKLGAIIWLKWFDLRVWLAHYGLFCKTVKYVNEKGEEGKARLIK